MINFILLSMCCLIISCASGTHMLDNVDDVRDISSINTEEPITCDNAEKILQYFSIDYNIPNPLIVSARKRTRFIDPNHEDTIFCRAVLLDDYSTEADIIVHCKKDSLDEQSSADFRKSYYEQYIREGMFRIRISLESGFSPKSMEHDHWSLYIENSHGVQIEPVDIIASDITAIQDSIYSKFNQIHIPKNVLNRDLTLYFNRTTFFGEDLFGMDNQFILFIMSRKRKTVARIGWDLSGKKGK